MLLNGLVKREEVVRALWMMKSGKAGLDEVTVVDDCLVRIFTVCIDHGEVPED